MAACTRVSISAIRHQVALTRLPPPCRGLSRAQLVHAANAAADMLAGAVRGKELMRARRRDLRALLPHLSPTAAPQRAQPLSGPGPGQASSPPFGLIALAAWLITVGLGISMMARWITRGGLRRDRAGAAGPRPVMNFAHLGLALAGLASWISYLVTGLAGLAWVTCVLVLPVTGLGMSLLIVRAPERTGAAVAVPVAQPVPAGAGGEPAPALSVPRPARRLPTLVLVAHVTFAVATMLFTLLATTGAGGA